MPREQYECRFCLQVDEKQNLLAPCLCKGSYKYVHNACLLEWYKLEPVKGSVCNVCSFLYRQEYTTPLELWKSTSLFVNVHLYYPFFFVITSHWLYMQGLHYIGIPNTDFLYSVYQFFWHLAMITEYLYALYRVKNRQVYANHWLMLPRPLIPIIHTYLLLILPRTGLLGGISADMCMMYYFYEHHQILDAMNTNIRIRFLSRPPRT
jgi:hypothetical protein